MNSSYGTPKISAGARSDIAEVLDQYVVRLIKEELSAKFTDISTRIDRLKKAVDDELPLLPANVQSEIFSNSFFDEIRDKLNDISAAFDSEKFTDISNSIDKLKKAVKDELPAKVRSEIIKDSFFKETLEKLNDISNGSDSARKTDKQISEMRKEISRQNELIEAQSRIIKELSETISEFKTVMLDMERKISENKRNSRIAQNRLGQMLR